MHEGAVNDIITNPVGLLVPANTSSAAQTNVVKGTIRETPRIKKTSENLDVLSTRGHL